MSPAVATSVLERRGTIRNRARAGEDPKAIAAALRVGTRTVLGILAMPETDLERDAADLLAGWSPDCMDAPDWRDWQRMNPGNVGGGKALKPCWDCPLEFAVEMRAIARCNGSPGRPVGRPVRETSLIALPPVPLIALPPVPVRQAFVHQADIQAQIEQPTEEAVDARVAQAVEAAAVIYPEPSPTEEEPVSDAAPNPLMTLSEAAESAADAHRTKLLADEAWEEARGALTAAWADVGPIVAPADPVEALGELVDVTERATDAGVVAKAEAPVATFGFRKRSPSKAQKAREKIERAERVMAAMARHGDDVSAVAAELGMRANAVVMVAKHARARAAKG